MLKLNCTCFLYSSKSKITTFKCFIAFHETSYIYFYQEGFFEKRLEISSVRSTDQIMKNVIVINSINHFNKKIFLKLVTTIAEVNHKIFSLTFSTLSFNGFFWYLVFELHMDIISWLFIRTKTILIRFHNCEQLHDD